MQKVTMQQVTQFTEWIQYFDFNRLNNIRDRSLTQFLEMDKYEAFENFNLDDGQPDCDFELMDAIKGMEGMLTQEEIQYFQEFIVTGNNYFNAKIILEEGDEEHPEYVARREGHKRTDIFNELLTADASDRIVRELQDKAELLEHFHQTSYSENYVRNIKKMYAYIKQCNPSYARYIKAGGNDEPLPEGQFYGGSKTRKRSKKRKTKRRKSSKKRGRKGTKRRC